jgi:hypothetical protein
MGRTAKKLNFLIEEAVCRDLETMIPAGKRSRFVNDALRRELETVRRKTAMEKIISSTSKDKKFSSRYIIEGLARDRRAH